MKKKVLIIYTGGTIGMKKSDKGYVPDPDFAIKVRQIPELYEPGMPTFDILSLDPILDSSNMNPADWDENYSDYDGFIVLHGTDTMAYTASALSFMLENLNSPVIVTGSQIPMCEVRNDARDNIITSLLICGSIGEELKGKVTLYFENKLMLGCRTVKTDAVGFSAFESPNFPPVANVGVKININQFTHGIDFNPSVFKAPEESPVEDMVPAPREDEDGKFHFIEGDKGKKFEVAVIRLFPGISGDFMRNIMQPPLKGLVIEAYGVGNGPSKESNPELFDAIKAGTDKGIVAVAVTQCLRGGIMLDQYEASLKSAGVISGKDMTTEAALAKLYYLISKKQYSEKEVRNLIGKNLRGELTDI
jgi:L-asparaginase